MHLGLIKYHISFIIHSLIGAVVSYHTVGVGWVFLVSPSTNTYYCVIYNFLQTILHTIHFARPESQYWNYRIF